MWACSNLSDLAYLYSGALTTPFDLIWFKERHQCWSREADSELRRRTASRQVKFYVGWHSVEIFAILVRRRFEVCVPIPKLRDKVEPSGLAVIPSSLVFVNYSNVALCESADEQAHIWRIAIS